MNFEIEGELCQKGYTWNGERTAFFTLWTYRSPRRDLSNLELGFWGIISAITVCEHTAFFRVFK